MPDAPSWLARFEAVMSSRDLSTLFTLPAGQVPPRHWSWTDGGWWYDATDGRASPDLAGVTRMRGRI